MKKCLVLGAGGLIGSNLVARLHADGHYVRAVSRAHFNAGAETLLMDLRRVQSNDPIFTDIDEVYQLAADAGGIAYETDTNHDAQRLRDNVQINLNVLEACRFQKVPKVFFPSSGVVYASLPEYRHVRIGFDLIPVLGPSSGPTGTCVESDVPPANPDSEYGWEKIFSERLYAAYARQYGLQVRIARIHSTYGTPCIWDGPRARAPAAICRKVAQAHDTIEIYGDGQQTRSFMHVDDCVEGILRLMASEFPGPVNLGSSEMVTINRLVDLVCEAAGKSVQVRNIAGPTGVRGRCSDNTLIREKLKWAPSIGLREGIVQLYDWVEGQVDRAGLKV